MHLRVSDRRRVPERVEGIEEGTTVRELKQIACWVLGKSSLEVKLVVDGNELLDEASTLARYGVKENSLILVDIVEGAEVSPVAPPPSLRKSLHSYAPVDKDITQLQAIRGINITQGGLVFQSSLTAACLTPRTHGATSKKPLDVYWYVNFAGGLFARRAKTSFKLPPTLPPTPATESAVTEISSKLNGLHVWSCEAAPDRSFVTLFFARERAAATWAHSHSPTLSKLPLDAFRKVTSYLSLCGEMEISAIDRSTRQPHALLPFSQCDVVG